MQFVVRGLAASVVAAAAGAFSPLDAQRTLRLAPPNAVLEHEFTRITGVRELSDGRALVSDAGDRSLWIADWGTKRTRRLGREGRGPGEYASVGGLLALSADSTLLVDGTNARYLLLAGDSIVETVAAGAPALRAGARTPAGADARGYVIFTRAISNAAPGDATALPRLDSLYLLRVARATGAVDTLARMRARPTRVNVRGPANRPTSIDVVSNPLAAGDLAAMFEDGWIAIARVAPYAVDWVSPAAALTAGAPFEAQGRPLTEADKRDVLQRNANQNGTEPPDPASRNDWPERMPPFLPGALVPASTGDLWIRTSPVAGRAETTYDIVNRRGALVSRLVLGDAEHVVAAGRLAVYTVHVDEDGIQRLRRYALPR